MLLKSMWATKEPIGISFSPFTDIILTLRYAIEFSESHRNLDSAGLLGIPEKDESFSSEKCDATKPLLYFMAEFSELSFDNRLARTGIRTCQVYLIIMYRSLIYLALLGALNSTPCSWHCLPMQIESTWSTRHVFLILLLLQPWQF